MTSATTDVILSKPQVVAANMEVLTADAMLQRWQQYGVRFTPDTRILREAAAVEQPQEGMFLLVCRSARDYGYLDEKRRPTLAVLYKHAQDEGLLLASPRIACMLLARRTPVVLPGQACLVAMEPLLDTDGRLYISHIQAIPVPSGGATMMVRMMMGTPDLEYNINQAVLFLKSVPEI